MKKELVKQELPLSLGQINYLKTYRQHRLMIVMGRFLLLTGFLLLWEGSVALRLLDSFFFSSPLRIFSLFLEMTKDYVIWNHIGITLWETCISFLLVTLFSLLAAIGLILFPRAAEVLEPVLVILNALPKSALAPLIIVWLGTGMRTIIIAGMSVALFGSIINMYTGFSQVEEEKIKLIYTLGGNKKDTLTKVILPSSIPVIISNMKVNIGLCLVGVIIGEFLAAKEGLGYLIIYGSQIFKLDLLILSILILCVIAIVLYQLIHLLEKKWG
ncbi:MAG: ABC transporter permease [Lachnospiraceae bacterium]|nr:ABC transporter permease [Lachnospiraceae bacterium]